MSIKKKVSLVLHMIKHENIEPVVNCDLIHSFYMINLGGMGHCPFHDILSFKIKIKINMNKIMWSLHFPYKDA